MARLASMERQDRGVVSIVTLSTPHIVPPVTFEAEIESLYRSINTRPSSVPILSICGGVSDVEIVSDACRLPSDDPNLALTVMTSAMAGAWTSVDHQAIVWCHQIRWSLASLLLRTASAPAKLFSTAKDIFSGSALSSRESAIGRRDHRKFPRGDFSISVSDFNSLDLPASFKLQECIGGECRILKFTSQAYPRPKDTSAPFPAPGEGVRSTDSAHLLIVDPPTSHYDAASKLVIEGLPVGSSVAVGQRCTEFVTGSTWSEYDVSASD